jgi:NADP-dependent 3-hydroxy acid dehydrogenase YdfG
MGGHANLPFSHHRRQPGHRRRSRRTGSRAGHQVVFTGRNQQLIDAIANKTGAHGLRADVSNADDNTRTVDSCAELLGGVDVLVNNAGLCISRTRSARSTCRR